MSGVAFVTYLHGGRVLWAVAIIAANFALVQHAQRVRRLPLLPLLWATNVALLFACSYYSGFNHISFASLIGGGGVGAALDRLVGSGVYSWAVQYPLTFLRLLSFVCDRHWAATHRPLSPKAKADDGATEQHLPLEQYGIVAFVAYVFYIPLYIAGPIVSFNAFIRSLEAPQSKIRPLQLLVMLMRVAAYALLLEVMLHYQFYYNININRLFNGLQPIEVAWAGYFTLNFMYLKFTTIWRLFRVWALFDGVAAEENMLRCVNNNYTFAGFWRQWHATLNKWILRYIYIPLGGSSSQRWSMWVIFTFVGLWHDLWWRWLAWAWINCCCFSLELLVQHVFKTKVT